MLWLAAVCLVSGPIYGCRPDGGVALQQTTEAQCRALVRAMKRDDHRARVWCISPTGEVIEN